jgi:hypothetical protein
MLRLILGIVVGFVAWSIIWVGSEEVLMAVSPDWYGAHHNGFERALVNGEGFEANSTIMIMSLARSIITSIMAGFLSAVVANESKRSTLILGVILLLVGVMVEISAWRLLPIWYHFIFLFLLIPMTMLGGKLKTSK